MKSIGIDEGAEGGRVHGNPPKGEKDGGAQSARIPCVVEGKEAGHSGKRVAGAKRFDKNGRAGKDFEEEC